LQPLKNVACPRCGKLTPFVPDNKWRPFCSERCKMIDLGAWAAESYRVPAEDQIPEDEEPSPKRPGS
jgi:endogenous inhibitor of DNA gyrase (YacG/DUF329 family)